MTKSCHCNDCDNKVIVFNGRNGHYLKCGAKSGDNYVGYCRRGTTGLFNDAAPEWCPLRCKEREV